MNNFVKSALAAARARSKTWAWIPAGARACFSSLLPGQNPCHPPTPGKIVPVQASVGRDSRRRRRTLRDYEYHLRALRVSWIF